MDVVDDCVTVGGCNSSTKNVGDSGLPSPLDTGVVTMASDAGGCNSGAVCDEETEVGESEEGDGSDDDEDDEEDDDDEGDDDDDDDDGDGDGADMTEEGADCEIEEESTDETESDEDDEGEVDKNYTDAGAVESTQLESEMLSESDGDETTMRCPICLARLGMQCVGSPETCDHIFCLDCILEWAKNVNTCPVDRQTFSLVLVRQGLDGVIYRQIPIENNQLHVEEEPVQDLTFCEVCGRSDREDRLLLCDGCDLGYHLECLDPPLDSVPRGDWFCTDCVPQQSFLKVESDVSSMPSRRRNDVQASRSTLQIARTIVAERVRNVVARNRRELRLTDSEENSDRHMSSGSKSNTGVIQKKNLGVRKSAKSTKRRKRRKVSRTKVKILEDGTKVVVKTKRRRRKLKKKCKGKNKLLRSARTKRPTPLSTKTRLAGRLGIAVPPVGRQIPVSVKTSGDRSAGFFDSRGSGVVSCGTELSILGNRDEFDPFSEADETAARQFHDRNQMASKLLKHSVPSVPRPSETSGRFDVLSEIMKSQSSLHRNLSDVVINKDGSLLPPPVVLTSTTIQPVLHPSTTVSVATNSCTPNVTRVAESIEACGVFSEVDTRSTESNPPLGENRNDSNFGNPMEATKSENFDLIQNVETALSTTSSDCAVISKCLQGSKNTYETSLHAQIQTNETLNQCDSPTTDTKPERLVLDVEIGSAKSVTLANRIQPKNGDSNEIKGDASKKDACQIEKKKPKIEFSSISHFLTVLREAPKNINTEDEVSADVNPESKISSHQYSDNSQQEPLARSDTQNENKSHSRSRECSNQKALKRSRSRSRGRAARGKKSRSRSGEHNRRGSRRSRSRQHDRSQRETRKSRSRDRSRDRSRRDKKRSRSRSRDRRERRSRSRDQSRFHDKQRTGTPNRGRYNRRSASRSKDNLDQLGGISVKDGGRQRDRKRSRSRSREQNRQRARRRSGSPPMPRNQSRQKEWDSSAAGREEQGRLLQNSYFPGSNSRLQTNSEQSSFTHLENELPADKRGLGRDFEGTVMKGEQSFESGDDNWRHKPDDCKSRISVIASVSQVDNERRDTWHSQQRHSSDGVEELCDVPLEYDPSRPTDDAKPASRSTLQQGIPPRGPPPFAWQLHDHMPRFDNRLPPPPILHMQVPPNNPPPHSFFNRPPPGTLHPTASQSGGMPAAFGFIPNGGVQQPFRVESFPSRLPPPPPPSFQNTGRLPLASADSSNRPPFTLVQPPQQLPRPPQPQHVVRLQQTMERQDSVPLLIRGPVEFQQLHRFVIMPQPSVGQPVHLSEQPRFAMCQIQQMPQNILRLPMGQPPMSHPSLVLGQQLIMPPPGTTLQLRQETAHARPLGQLQLGLACIDQNSAPSILSQSMFDARFVRPPSSVAENLLEGSIGHIPSTITSTQQMQQPDVTTHHHSFSVTQQPFPSQQQSLPMSNSVFMSERSRSPSLSPTESEELMAGEIFSQRSNNVRDSFDRTGYEDSGVMNTVRQSFLQEVPSCSDDQFNRSTHEPPVSNGKSLDKLEPEAVLPIYASHERIEVPDAKSIQLEIANEENKVSADSTLQPGAVKSAGPLDPRALLQYLLHQTRQTTTVAVVENPLTGAASQLSVRNYNDSGNDYFFESSQNPKESRQATHSAGWSDSFNRSGEIACEDPVDMNLDSPDSTQETFEAGGGNDVYSPSQADYAASPVGVVQPPKESGGKQLSKHDRQTRVVEAVKNALKPHYSQLKITKDEYKHIMRSAVPKICHSKGSDVDQTRVQKFIDICVDKSLKARKQRSTKKHGSSRK